MDFTHTSEQTEASALAGTILGDACTPDRLRAVDARGAERFDADLWRALGDAGLLGLSLPESYDGSGLGLLELCSILIEAGRVVAPVPLVTHAVAAAALAAHAPEPLQAQWLPRAATGAAILAVSAGSPLGPWAERSGEGWTLNGARDLVVGGTLADLLLVVADGEDGPVVCAVDPDASGVEIQAQRLTDGDLAARVAFTDTPVGGERVLAAGAARWLEQHGAVALCAHQQGVVEGALTLTSSYAKSREQFGRPIGTFQAVSQRLADGYIDVLGSRLMLWQAAWRLAEELPADAQIAAAALWACDAGHRLAHTAVHVHGGVGIDLDGETHRYFSAAKRNEFLLGGTTAQALAVGRVLAGA